MKTIRRVMGLVLCLCMFAVFALGSGSSDGSSGSKKVGEVSSEDDSATESGEAEDDGQEPDDREEATEDTIKDIYEVGDTFTNKGLSIVYVGSSYYESDNEFIEPADGKQYIRLYFHVDNQSDSDKNVSEYDFTCYADGYECDKTYFEDDLSANLSPGRTGDGAVYFEVPKDASEIEIEYEYDTWNEKFAKFAFRGDQESGLTFESNTSVSENAYKVGDVIENNDIRISYLNAAEYVSDNMFSEPEEGKKYIYIELEVENISDSDQSISSFSFECYADGASCDGYYGLDDDLSATLSAGRKAKGTVAFEVPVDAQVIEIEYEDNFWTEEKIIFLYEE